MATELGQAYVQIIPSAKGISGKITQAIDPESKSAGKSSGNSIASGIKNAIAAAGIGLAIKSAISEGAELEQSIGGIETLFKDNAGMMRKYADEAYKTVGVSANDYMQNVTSFSASLLQSLGGDTKKAGEVANKAMIDMGDNANKMGTDMRDIQNAYQGFAKQNYTMLDNLKLGYGGTKTEMERLLKDAQKLSGVEYNIDNLADVYTAVGVVQDQLGITGTTALEAEETLSGSLNAMKSSFKNLLGNLAIGEDIKPSLQTLASTVSTFLFDNFLPMVWNILSALPEGIVTFIQEAAPQFLEAGGAMLNSLLEGITTNIPIFLEGLNTFLTNVITWIQEQLPLLLQEGVTFISEFANGIFEGLPEVLESMGEILNSILVAIFEALPSILDSGMELIENLAQGVMDNLPAIVDSIKNIISNVIDTIFKYLPELLKKGIEMVGKLAEGIWNNLPQIISTIFDLLSSVIRKIGEHLPEFLKKAGEIIVQMAKGLWDSRSKVIEKGKEIVIAIKDSIFGMVKDFVNVGSELVKGLWRGISNVKDWILSKIGGFVDGIVGGIKNFFGIRSPSKLMANEVGKFLPEGLAVGIEGNVKPLTDTMDDLGKTTVSSFQPNLAMAGASYGGQQFNIGYDFDGLISSIDRLANRDVVVKVNDKEIARQTAEAMNQELDYISDKQRRGVR